MRHAATLALVLATLVFALGCDSRLEETDGGGVLLSVSDFDGVPNVVDTSEVRALGFATLGTITIQSIVRDIDGSTSDLMNIEMQSYEVTFSRGDTGTRLPPSLVQPSLIYVPAGGSTDLNNLRILQSPQLSNTPLSDLQNFGIDRETGSSVVILNIRLRFFGKTIGGRDVATEPRAFTVEFRQ